MAEEVRIWQVDKAESLTEVKRSKLDREARIEKWISSDISLLSPDLLIIGEQVMTAFGKVIDLLCIDRSGNLVIIELKRDMTPREVTAQALDYASWVKDLDAEGIDEIAAKHLKGETLEDAFQSKFGIELPEVITITTPCWSLRQKLTTAPSVLFATCLRPTVWISTPCASSSFKRRTGASFSSGPLRSPHTRWR